MWKNNFNNKGRVGWHAKFAVFFAVLLALAGCGGGGSSSSSGGNDDVIAPPPPPVVYTVSGVITDENQQPLAGALASVDGIQALTLSNDQGQFIVESDVEFDSTAVVTVGLDGFESFTQQISLAGGISNNEFELASDVPLVAFEPWGFLEINVTPNGNNRLLAKLDDLQVTSSASQACDCVIDIAGSTSKKGAKNAKLYILLVADASGSSSANSIGDKSVFDVEIESLSALVDNLTQNTKTFVGVIRFASEAELVLDFTTDLAEVKTALAGLTPETSGTSGAATNYQAALELIKTTFSNVNTKKKDIKTVAFLSDGIPTAPFGSGSSQEKEDRISAITAAASVAEDGITVNTFPVNINSSLTTLPAVAAITEGLYFQHDSTEVASKLPNDSLVGIVGMEMVNETTAEDALEMILFPDGKFAGSICLTADETNQIKITPSVCESCDKIAYQKIKVKCDKEECDTCAGQVTNLIMQYNGAADNANIKVTQRKNANSDYILYDDVVQPGERFEFFGAKRDKTMGSSIKIWVNDALNAEFVTSCGQPKIGPGRINGDFEVSKGYSRNGGLLCPI